MQERKKPETLRLHALMPALTVSDISKSLAFYREILGFVVVEEMFHEGELRGAVLQAGSARLLLGQDDFAKGRDRPKGAGFRIYGVTRQNIDQIAANIRATGGELAEEPKNQPWGARDFAVTDPDGFKLSITTEVAE